jgi:hypothetical protein
VTPGYFELMHMPLMEGRGFEPSDTAESSAVAVVNEEMAKLWPRAALVGAASLASRLGASGPGKTRERSALGEVMTIGGRQIRVVGVLRTARYFEAGETPRPFFYLPFAQSYTSRMFLHVETAGNPANAPPAVIAQARSIDPRQPVSEVRALDRYVDEGALFGVRTGVRVAGTAAACALLLALAGVYVSLARAVQSSRKEIGIRLALGATRGSIAIYFTLRGMRLVTTGALVGTAFAALLMTTLISKAIAAFMPGAMAGALFQINGSVPLAALACAFASVMLVGAIACVAPAWRAAKLDPAVALRQN